MIFIRNEKFKEYLRAYPLTSVILGLNLLVFVLMLIEGGMRANVRTLIAFGALTNAGILQGEWWRLVSSMFVHIGFEHILFNAFAIYVFLPPLEKLMGSIRFALLYFLGGVAGNLLTVWALKGSNYISAGASGAIFAIYGGYFFISLFRRGQLDRDSRKTALIILGVALVYSFIETGVNIWAHLGGVIAGIVLFPLLNIRRTKRVL